MLQRAHVAEGLQCNEKLWRVSMLDISVGAVDH